jgi:hypothetical protein
MVTQGRLEISYVAASSPGVTLAGFGFLLVTAMISAAVEVKMVLSMEGLSCR